MFEQVIELGNAEDISPNARLFIHKSRYRIEDSAPSLSRAAPNRHVKTNDKVSAKGSN